MDFNRHFVHTLRTLRKTPAFSIMTIAILALRIGVHLCAALLLASAARAGVTPNPVRIGAKDTVSPAKFHSRTSAKPSAGGALFPSADERDVLIDHPWNSL